MLPNLLVGLLDTGDHEEEEEVEEEPTMNLTFTISVKAMMNDDLTIIIL